MMIEWAYKYCDFQYLLKTDDDVFVNLPNLYKLLDSKDTQHTRLYLGRAQSSTLQYRVKGNTPSRSKNTQNTTTLPLWAAEPWYSRTML